MSRISSRHTEVYQCPCSYTVKTKYVHICITLRDMIQNGDVFLNKTSYVFSRISIMQWRPAKWSDLVIYLPWLDIIDILNEKWWTEKLANVLFR